MDLVAEARAGNRRALARLLSLAERGGPEGVAVLRRLYPLGGNAHVVGVTGPPGAGKSTLVGALARVFRARGRTVGIVAVDPSSPFTGGAILGDRVRMLDLHSDPGVFVRSMASRGAVGGLARGTADLVAVFDAVGMDLVIVETVGAGQDEVEIARAADTTLVVTVPGLGDDVQTLKAGILEIADLLIVNKADRAEADLVAGDLSAMLQLGQRRDWEVPVLRTSATEGRGVLEVADAIERHRAFLESRDAWHTRRAAAAQRRVASLVEEKLRAVLDRLFETRAWRERFAASVGDRADPFELAEMALNELGVGMADERKANG